MIAQKKPSDLRTNCPPLNGQLFFPLWGETPVKIEKGSDIKYSVTIPTNREERWMSDLAIYLQTANFDAGTSAGDFQILVLESKRFKKPTKDLTIEIIPIQSKLEISNGYFFKSSILKDQSVVFQEIASKKSEKGYTQRVDRGYLLSDVQFDEGGSLICLLNIQQSKGKQASFPTTEQLDTSFKVQIK